jgi:hypothetical protein
MRGESRTSVEASAGECPEALSPEMGRSLDDSTCTQGGWGASGVAIVAIVVVKCGRRTFSRRGAEAQG